MAESLAAANAAWAEFEQEYPEVGNYFCFLAGFGAGARFEESADAV